MSGQGIYCCIGHYYLIQKHVLYYLSYYGVSFMGDLYSVQFTLSTIKNKCSAKVLTTTPQRHVCFIHNTRVMLTSKFFIENVVYGLFYKVSKLLGSSVSSILTPRIVQNITKITNIEKFGI